MDCAMRDFLALLQQLPFFVSVCDLRGKLIWTNRITYGLDDSIIGKPVDLHIVEEDKAQWWVAFRRVIHWMEIVDYSVKVNVPEPPGWVMVNGKLSPYVVRGKTKYVVAIAHDATLRDKANPLGKFVLSPIGKLVVRYLLQVGSAKGPSIGRHVGEVGSNGQASPKLRASLAEKVERGVLSHVNGGYAITPEFAPFAAILANEK